MIFENAPHLAAWLMTGTEARTTHVMHTE